MQFGPGNAQAMPVAQRLDGLRAPQPFGVAAFAELRRVDQRAFEPVGGGLCERVGNRRRRDDGQCEIDRLGNGREVRIHRPPPQLAALGVDQIQPRRKSAIFEVLVDFARPAATARIGRTDDGDVLGTEKMVDGTKHNYLSMRDFPAQPSRSASRHSGISKIVCQRRCCLNLSPSGRGSPPSPWHGSRPEKPIAPGPHVRAACSRLAASSAASTMP